MSVRNRFRLCTVLVVLFGVLAGCGSVLDPPPPSEAQLVLSTISPPKSFNPVIAKETSTTDITNLMFVGLTQTDGVTGEVQPRLAQSWTTLKGGRIWEFELRRDLTWSDGAALTAEDVVFTYNRLYLNPDVTTSARFMLLMDRKPPKVTAPSTYTVRFEYPEPYAPFARVAGLAIMPRHVLVDRVEAGTFNSTWGVDTNPDEIVVNGPFKLKDYATAQRVELVKNPHYYETDDRGRSLPRLERVIFEIVQNRGVALQKFIRGGIDVLAIQGQDVPILAPREEELDFTLTNVGTSLGTTFLSFNMNTDTNPETGKPYVTPYRQKWFNDRAFRRAVSYGIARKQIIDIVMNGQGTPTYGPVSPANKPFYSPRLEEYPHRPDRARQILRENGYRDRDGDGIREGPQGNPVSFVLNTNSGNDARVEMTEIIRQDLADLGFDVTFSQMEFNTLVNKLNSSFDWQAVVIGFTGSLDPHFGSNLWLSSADLHIWHPRQKQPHREWEARVDEIFRRAVKITDRSRRRQLYYEWQRIVNQVQPVIFTVNPDTIYAIRNTFTHVNPTPIGGFTHNIERIGVKGVTP